MTPSNPPSSSSPAQPPSGCPASARLRQGLLQLSIQGLTWRGQPRVQQDAMLVDAAVYQHANGCTAQANPAWPTVVAVADGLAHSPQSQQASKALLALVLESSMAMAGPLDLPALQQQLSERLGQNPALYGSSCTLAAVVLLEDRAVIQHVGDSRVYHWSAAQRSWRQCTQDHSVIHRMIEQGEAPASAAADCGTLYQGLDLCFVVDPLEQLPTLRPHTLTPQAGDFLLLCTDGVHDLVAAAHWPAPDEGDSLKAFLLQLRRQVYAASAYDNGTAVLVRFEAPPPTTALIPDNILEESWPIPADPADLLAYLPERYRACLSLNDLLDIAHRVGTQSPALLTRALKQFLWSRRQP